MRAEKKIDLVIYDSQRRARCFSLNLSLVKTSLFIFSFLVLALVACLLFIFCTKVFSKKVIPPVRSHIETSFDQEQWEKKNRELLEKVKQGVEGEALFSLIKKPLSFKNLVTSSVLNLSELQLSRQGDQIELNFSILNKDSANQSGYIFILLKQDSQISFYPKIHSTWKDSLAYYDEGEKFSFSKLRPVKATFSHVNSEKVSYKILIFSSIGDLLVDYTGEEKDKL